MIETTIKLEKFIAELKERGTSIYSTTNKYNPEATVNVWYVVAKLEEILLDNKDEE